MMAGWRSKRLVYLTLLAFAMGAVSLALLSPALSLGMSGSRLEVYGHKDVQSRMHRGNSVAWRVLDILGKRRVRIGRYVGWCPGPDKKDLGPRPQIRHVRQVVRPQKVILTAFLIHRASRGCLGVETLVDYVVILRHRLSGRSLFDGSVSPPVKRWPRSGRFNSYLQSTVAPSGVSTGDLR